MTEQDSPGGVSTDDAGTSCTLLALSSSRGLPAVAETDNQPHGLTSGDRAELSADSAQPQRHRFISKLRGRAGSSLWKT